MTQPPELTEPFAQHPRLAELVIELLHHWFVPEGPPLAITRSEVLGVVPLEVTDGLLDAFRRLADRHERGFMAETIHNARALHDQVLARHPDRVNPGA